MKNNRAKKILSFVLAASMVFAAMAPSMSFAAGDAVRRDVVTLSEGTEGTKEKKLTVKEAKEAVEDAKEAVAEAEKDKEEKLAAAEEKAATAQANLEKAIATQKAAKEAVEKAGGEEKTAAEEELAKANVLVENAKTAKETADKAVTDLTNAVEAAKVDLMNAYKNLKDVQVSLIKGLEEDVTAKEVALEVAKAKKVTEEHTEEKKAEDVKTAEKALKEANVKFLNAKADLAEVNLAEKQETADKAAAKLEDAEKKLAEAEKDADGTLQAAVASQKVIKEAADKAVEEAQKAADLAKTAAEKAETASKEEAAEARTEASVAVVEEKKADLGTKQAKAKATDANLANVKAALAAAEKAYNEADGKDLTPTQLEALKTAVEAAKKVVSKTVEVKEAADKAVEEAQTALKEAELEAELAKAEEAVVKAADEKAALEAQVALAQAKFDKAEFELAQNPDNDAKAALVNAQKALEEAKKALAEFDKEEAKEIARIAGKDRYETALNVAKELKAEGSERVVLASGANYADALVGARYAKDKDAVLLLVDGTLTDDVKAYLELATKEVTILGGIASVKEDVEKELKDAKYTVERIAGKDRYKTAVEVANKMETVENILVASGENYADALVASAAANKLGKSAVLLTEKSKLNDDAKEYMTTNKETAKKAYVFGGENSVTDETMAAVKEIVEVERVKGTDRDATAVAAAKEFFKESTLAVVASGSNYADALVAGTMDEPVLLVTKNVNDTVKTYLKDQIEDAKVIGGTNSVSDAILKDIAANLK